MLLLLVGSIFHHQPSLPAGWRGTPPLSEGSLWGGGKSGPSRPAYLRPLDELLRPHQPVTYRVGMLMTANRLRAGTPQPSPSRVVDTAAEPTEPTLMDYEAIDVYWRRDIEAEKAGLPHYATAHWPAQQQYQQQWGQDHDGYGMDQMDYGSQWDGVGGYDWSKEGGSAMMGDQFEHDTQLLTEKEFMRRGEQMVSQGIGWVKSEKFHLAHEVLGQLLVTGVVEPGPAAQVLVVGHVDTVHVGLIRLGAVPVEVGGRGSVTPGEGAVLVGVLELVEPDPDVVLLPQAVDEVVLGDVLHLEWE